MTQFLLTEEQKAQKTFYDQRLQLTKERLQMYIKLKNAAQAQLQLNTLDNLVSQAGSEKLAEDFLYTQASYYYTFGQNEQLLGFRRRNHQQKAVPVRNKYLRTGKR